LFKCGHQQGSFVREVAGTLQIAIQERAFGLRKKRAGVVERLARFAGQLQAVKARGALPQAFLEVEDLLAQRSLPPGAFTRLERGYLGRRRLDGFAGAFSGAKRFGSERASSAWRGSRRARLRGRHLCGFRRWRFLDHQAPAFAGGRWCGCRGRRRRVNYAHCGLSLGASPNQHRDAAN
jgi:hypothetical protein